MAPLVALDPAEPLALVLPLLAELLDLLVGAADEVPPMRMSSSKGVAAEQEQPRPRVGAVGKGQPGEAGADEAELGAAQSDALQRDPHAVGQDAVLERGVDGQGEPGCGSSTISAPSSCV